MDFILIWLLTILEAIVCISLSINFHINKVPVAARFFQKEMFSAAIFPKF